MFHSTVGMILTLLCLATRCGWDNSRPVFENTLRDHLQIALNRHRLGASLAIESVGTIQARCKIALVVGTGASAALTFLPTGKAVGCRIFGAEREMFPQPDFLNL